MFKTTKNKLIFVILFCIICVVATSILIIYERIDKEETEDDGTLQENINKEIQLL